MNEERHLDELTAITTKYDADYVRQGLSTAPAVTLFAGTFYRDVGEVYDCLTRIKHSDRNPTGFEVSDAPILGLLVRAWKLFKEVVHYYDEDNAEVVGVLERPLLEAVVMARYLMSATDGVMEDYRKCSYKDRLRLLRDLKEGSAFTQTKAGRRLVASITTKLELDGFEESSFDVQRQRRWRVRGKTFRDIFSVVEHDDLYEMTYGMMSESIHGSWNDSMDYDLIRNADGTFSANPFYRKADIRFVTPLLKFTNPAYRSWLKRIGAQDDGLTAVLDWIERVNAAIYRRFDELYDDNQPAM